MVHKIASISGVTKHVHLNTQINFIKHSPDEITAIPIIHPDTNILTVKPFEKSRRFIDSIILGSIMIAQ